MVRYSIPQAFSDINKVGYQNMGVCHNTSLNFLIVLASERHLFRSSTDNTLHLEFSYAENVSLTNGYAILFFAILTFRCLKSVTTLLSLVNFLLINITELEYTENPSFKIPI